MTSEPTAAEEVFSPGLLQSGRLLSEKFRAGSPFPHAVVDGFLRPEFCRRLAAEFPPYDAERFRNERGQPGKAHREDVRALGPAYRRLDDALRSPEFLALMSEVTGIPGLVFDPSYFGGGTHENLDDMELDAHVDFTVHPDGLLYRRLNLLLYLNEDWKEGWGGALRLHTDPWGPAEKDAVKTVLPLMNRAVVFAADRRSWHGFETIVPETGRTLSRKSFAAYLYTKEKGDDEPLVPRDLTVFVPPPLPERFRAGLTLSEEDARLLRRLVARRDIRLKYLYDRGIKLFNKTRSLEALLKTFLPEGKGR